MKRFLQVLSGGVIGAVVWAGVATAATTSVTCSIYNTGSDSFNSCTTNSLQDIRVTCENNTYIINSNAQNAGTGGANTSANTSAGGAVTGTALNENNQVVNIGAGCSSSVAAATPTPPTDPTPTATASTNFSTATPAPNVAVLPKTGESNVATTVALGVAALVAGLAVARLGLAAYRRTALK